MRKITKIILHCSATPNGRYHTAADIRKWHMEERGWLDIGYHYVIRTDGLIEQGRKEDVIGAHASGFNAHSIGVCLIGTDDFSPAQWAALEVLLNELLGRYPDAEVLGHCDLPGVTKTCPGFDAKAWWA